MSPIAGIQPFAELARRPSWVVYKGYDRALDRFVLLKVFDVAASEALTARVEAEARLVAKVTHPNVVAVHAAGQEAGRAYLVTEFVEGRSLAEALDEAPLPAPLALYVVREAAAGLQAAHRRGVLHRDVKPANVLLGFDGTVKLADFGLASAVGEAPTGEVRGTPGYLAPELVQGQPPGVAADLFALGVTLAETLTGRPVYRPSVEGHRLRLDAVLTVDPRPELAADPRIPAALVPVLQRLLAPDPDARYPDVAALLVDLDAARLRVGPADAATLQTYLADPAEHEAAAFKALPEPTPSPTEDAASLNVMATATTPDTTQAEAPTPAEPLRMGEAGGAEDVLDGATAAGSTGARGPHPSAERRVRWRPVVVGVGIVAVLGLAWTVGARWAGLSEAPTQAVADTTRSTADSLLATLPSEDRDAGDSLQPSAPAGAAVSDDRPPVPVTAPPSVGPSPSPTAKPTPPTSMPGASGVSGPVLLDERPPVPLEPGRVVVVCEPWAVVRFGTQRLGTTPLAAPLTFPPGTHTLTFENPDFPPHTVRVEVRPGETTSLRVSLWQTVARLTLDVRPWAEVAVDGRVWDTVPPQTRPLVLRPGSHVLRLKHPTLGTYETTIRVEAGEQRTLVFNLSDLLGS